MMTTTTFQKYLLGIDAGTTVIKSVIFDFDGNEVGSASQPSEPESPQSDWAQQNMDLFWQRTASTIADAIHQANIGPSEIAVVAPTGQGDGAWMIDRSGTPVCPAPLWTDSRATDQINLWQHEGSLSRLFEKGGSVLWPGTQAAILTWFEKYEPQIFRHIDKVLCCKDWIKYKLTGVVCTDESDASIPFMALANRSYSLHQMQLLGCEKFYPLLPPIRLSHEVIGRVTASASATTGLVEGTPVVSGMLDVAANILGTGIIDTGQSVSILGSTGINGIIIDKAVFTPKDVGHSVCHAPQGRWIRFLATMAGTTNLDWYLSNIDPLLRQRAAEQGSTVFELLDQALAEIPIGAGGVIFHPYLYGERAPFLNPDARAGFYGIGADTTANHLARAVYEGTAFSLRHCFENVGQQVTQVTLSGGGANSNYWCQMLADILGYMIAVPAGSQFGSLGAAMAGGVGIGIFDSYETAVKRCVRVGRSFHPVADRKKQYDVFFQLYRGLIEYLAPFWDERRKALDVLNAPIAL